jgi:hypothetical protein
MHALLAGLFGEETGEARQMPVVAPKRQSQIFLRGV